MTSRTRIFISHASQDATFAARLSNDLRMRGFDVWLDSTHMGSGDFVEQINLALERDVLVLVLTPAALQSNWVRQEVDAAIARSNNGWMMPPLVIEAYPFKAYEREKIPPLWNILHFVTAVARNSDKDEGLDGGGIIDCYADALNSIAQELRKANIVRPRVAMPVGLPRATSLVGRGEVVQRVIEGFRRDIPLSVFVVNGMGGVGKTAVAAEAVAQLSRDEIAFPGGAVWVSCEDLQGQDGLDNLFMRVARVIHSDVGSDGRSCEEHRAELTHSIQRWPRLLIALDNIEPQLDVEAIIDHLAIPNHSALLITARQSISPRRVASIPLSPLSQVDSHALFSQRLTQTDSARPVADDTRLIPSIARVLGGLPLAIELVAAYAGVQRLSLDAISQELEIDGLQAPSLTFDANRALNSRFHRSWRALSPQHRLLFASLPLLATTSFPREGAVSLAIASTFPNEIGSRETIESRRRQGDRDVATLVSFALIEPIAGKSLRLHPLLREFATERMLELPSRMIKALRDAANDFWNSFSPNSGYLDRTLKRVNEEFHEGRTSRELPTLDQLIEGTRKGALHSRWHDEPDLARDRALQSLWAYESMGNFERMGECYQLLAWLDEDAGDKAGAVSHYHIALDYFRRTKSHHAREVMADLKRLGDVYTE